MRAGREGQKKGASQLAKAAQSESVGRGKEKIVVKGSAGNGLSGRLEETLPWRPIWEAQHVCCITAQVQYLDVVLVVCTRVSSLTLPYQLRRPEPRAAPDHGVQRNHTIIDTEASFFPHLHFPSSLSFFLPPLVSRPYRYFFLY